MRDGKYLLEMQMKQKRKIVFFIVLFITSLFYLFFYFHDGIIMSQDGPTYVNMDADREPGYCIYLWIFRVIFGEDLGLKIATMGQCILAGVAATCLTFDLQKRFKLGWFSTGVMYFLEISLTLLNRFFAQRKYSYYNSICTEAIAYSFWIFFFIAVLGIIYDRDKKSIILSIVWSIVLISIRKHMMIAWPVMIVAIAIAFWKNKKWKAVVLALVTIVISFASVRLIDCSYNYFNRGVFEKHAGDSLFLLGNEIYVAEDEWVEYISDEDNKILFLKAMEVARENHYLMSDAPENIYEHHSFYADAYDAIKFLDLGVVFRDYQHEVLGFTDEALRIEDYYARVDEMAKELFMPSLRRLAKVVWVNFVAGIVLSIAKVRAGITEASWVIYILYFIVLAFAVKKKVPATWFGLITIFAMIVNLVLVSLILYTQMRYMLYNTAFFYQSGYLMVVELWGRNYGRFNSSNYYKK